MTATMIVKRIICIIILLLMPIASQGADLMPLVLFDQGHGQRFVIEQDGDLQLSRFAGLLRQSGVRVTSISTALTDTALDGVAGVIISGAFDSFSDAELDALSRFVNRGGHLAVLLHVAKPLSTLMARFDVDFSNAVLHERENVIDTNLNFRIADLSRNPLFNGISYFSVYGAWALNPGASAAIIARTSPQAWVDLDGNGVLSKGDYTGAFGIVVTGRRGAGSFVVFGDDALFQNRFLDTNNARLATNLGGWLVERR